jgi:hypothetical protein
MAGCGSRALERLCDEAEHQRLVRLDRPSNIGGPVVSDGPFWHAGMVDLRDILWI